MLSLISIVIGTVCVLSVYSDENINEYLNNYRNGRNKSSLCDDETCCTMTSANDCSMSGFTKDQSTIVLPGGETRCIFSTSTPYGFQVIPGDADKLLFYFQGGGACWTESTTSSSYCTTNASPQSLIGIFDRTNSENPYKNYTIVHAMYCSGDIWAGDVVRDYNDDAGQPVTQKGQANGQATLDWVKQQQDANILAADLSSLVIMGCSAGSIGTQLWAPTILETLKWKTAAVIPDSYAGLFPDGTQGPLIYGYGMCSWSHMPASLYTSCMNQQLTLQEFNAVGMKANADVPYAFIQSKIDDVQQAFYVEVGLSMNSPSSLITPTEFYEEVTDMFSTYNKENPNFLTYLVDGDQHCFSPYSLIFTADALGANDNNSKDNTGPMMTDWIGTLPLADGESIDTVCLGDLQGRVTDNTYCSSDVTPKEFTESYD